MRNINEGGCPVSLTAKCSPKVVLSTPIRPSYLSNAIFKKFGPNCIKMCNICKITTEMLKITKIIQICTHQIYFTLILSVIMIFCLGVLLFSFNKSLYIYFFIKKSFSLQNKFALKKYLLCVINFHLIWPHSSVWFAPHQLVLQLRNSDLHFTL